MTIGIDKIGFATSNYVLKLDDLAEKRGRKMLRLIYKI